MAGAIQDGRDTSMIGSDLDLIKRSVNRLITDVEALRAALMTHTHRTPTTNPGYTSTPVTNAPGAGSTGGTDVVLPATALTGFQVRTNNAVTT